MPRNITIRKTPTVALLVLSVLGLGMQMFLPANEAGCQCATDSVQASGNDHDIKSCCSKPIVDSGCCSKEPELATACCCNPNASVCDCDDCNCSEEKSPGQPLPAIPTSEIVTPTLVLAAPELGFPNPCEPKTLNVPKPFSAAAVLSSKQTCVLLSRFTC